MKSIPNRRFHSLVGRVRVPLLDPGPVAAKEVLKRRVSNADKKSLLSMEGVALNTDGSGEYLF